MKNVEEKKNADSLINRGNELYQSGNFEEAANCFSEAAQLDPNNADVFSNWGNELFNLAKIKQDETLFRESFEKYAKAIEIKPDYLEALNNWGKALYHLAKIKQDKSLFRESCEKYAKATELKPDYAKAFYNWGNALSELGIIKQKESLFKESFIKYAKATEIKPDYADAFYNWGTALYDLAKIKQNESLFGESFEKYDKATQLKPEDADAFYNWGTTLYDLAKIKQDESLFGESFEKYDKATQLKPEDADAFYNWGTALYDLAKIKKDKSLFRESCEKYAKATELKPDDADAFYNWGAALYDLAKIKKDESLFQKSCEKYAKATQLKPEDTDIFCNWGAALYDLGKIKQDKSLFKEATECFKKSRSDILDILVSFDDMTDREHIAQTDIFYSLLDSDTNDGNFFRETTKEKDIEKLKKYKDVYIRSMFIISQLYVNNENERQVAYYCEKTIAQKILFKEKKNHKFHLNAINYSNDPTEGRILFDYLYRKEKYPKREALSTEYGTFAGSFTFNHDSLNQFRLYGKEDGREGTGLSLVFRNSFFSKEVKTAMKQLKTKNGNTDEKEEKHALFRCMYIDPETRWIDTVGHKEAYLFYRKKNEEETAIEKKIEDYRKYIDNIVENVRMEMENLKAFVQDLDPAIVEQLLINLRYLTKHIAFKEEQECRIIKICHLKDVPPSKNFKQMYVKYDPKVSNHVEKIYFGPKADGMELFQDILTNRGLDIECRKSKNHLT